MSQTHLRQSFPQDFSAARSGRLFVLACLVTLAGAGPSRAGDWNVTPSFSQSYFVDTNPRLQPGQAELAFGTAGTLAFGLNGLGKDYRLDVNGALGYRVNGSFGGNPVKFNFTPSLSASYAMFDKVRTLTFTASYVRTAAEDVEFIEDLPIFVTSARNSLRAGMAYSQRLNERDTVNANLGIGTVVFDQTTGNLANSMFVETGADWRRRLTKRIGSSLGFGLDWRSTNNAQDLEQTTFRVRSGLDFKLSERLSARVGTGVRLVNSVSDDVDGIRRSRLSLGALADLGFDYSLKRGKVGLSLSYDVVPNALGALQNRFGLVGTGSYELNRLTSASLSSSYQIATALSGSTNSITQVLTVAPSLTRRISQTMSASLGYRFAVKDSDRGTAVSNSFTIGLTGKF
jgi:hypothetical protein